MLSLKLPSVTTSQLDTAATSSSLVVGSMYLNTTTGKPVVVTAVNAYSAVASASIPVGTVVYTDADPGTGWLQCDGRRVSQSTYSALFTAIGHRYSPVRYPWSSPAVVTGPDVAPTGQSYTARFSPDGRYLAVAHSTSPFVTIYAYSSGSIVKTRDPSVLPTGNARGVSWSPDGRYLAVAHDVSPYVTIYDWSSGVPVKISNPATLPTGTGLGVSWSPSGRYLAVAHGTSPYVTIYDWSSGAPVKIANPATLPTNSAFSCAWSPSGRYLAVAHFGSPYVTIYDWSSGSPVKISNPTTLPTNTAQTCSWSPDGRYLVVGQSSSPHINIYDWITGSPVRISNPATLPGDGGSFSGPYDISWTPDQKYMLVGSATGGVGTYFYDWTSGFPVKIADPSVLTNDDSGFRSVPGVAYSNDGVIFVSSGYAPYNLVYSVADRPSTEFYLPKYPGIGRSRAYVRATS